MKRVTEDISPDPSTETSESAWTGNEPVALDREFTVRVVDSGAVALFCSEIRGGKPAGPRRMLQRLGVGQAVVSVDSETTDGMQFLAVPIQDAVMHELPLEEERGAATLIGEWIDSLSREIVGFPEPRLFQRSGEAEEIDLEDGQALAAEPRKVIWVDVLEGTLHFQGNPDWPIEPGTILPLGSGTWLTAEGQVHVRTRTTAEIEDVAQISRGLRNLHELVLNFLSIAMESEAAQERERLRERHAMEKKAMRGALVGLAAVLDKDVSVGSSTGVPILDVMTIVGEAMNIEVKPPGASDASDKRADPVEAIARASRVRHRWVGITGKWWKGDAGPMVGFTNEEPKRPLALVQDRSLKYEVIDPEKGTRRRVDAQVAKEIANEAIVMYRPMPEKANSPLDLLKFTVARRGRDLTLVIVTGLLATLLGMLVPQATAVLMDQALPDANQRLLMELGLVLFAAAFGQAIFLLGQGFVLQRIGFASEADSQAALWDRLLRLRPSFFRKFSSGDLQARVSVLDDISHDLSGTTLTTFVSSVMALLNLGLLYYYSARLSLIALAIAGVVLLFTSTISTAIARKLRALIELDGELFGLVVQLIDGVGKLRVAGAAGRAYTHWVKHYTAMLRHRAAGLALRDVSMVFHSMLPTVSSILLFAFSIDLLMESRTPGGEEGLSLGRFLAFHAAFATFLAGVTSLASTCVSLLDISAKSKRIKPILDAEPEVDLTKSDPGRLMGRVTVEGVDFKYREDGRKILDDVNVRCEPGEFVAIVGPSGSGKSTLFRLLLGFETPASGSIAFDGQDMANLDVLAVRRQLGVVLQGGSLDAGSIFENIASGNVITLDEAWAAAEDAGIADEIRDMPMGMHTVVSVGGGNLSGGQRQRLLIARALAQRPRILLFDEATSALDNRTQAVVSESLEALNVTRIVVAHRLSTIQNADRIYVIEDGVVVQAGRFRELIEQEGLFARLMARQMA